MSLSGGSSGHAARPGPRAFFSPRVCASSSVSRAFAWRMGGRSLGARDSLGVKAVSVGWLLATPFGALLVAGLRDPGPCSPSLPAGQGAVPVPASRGGGEGGCAEGPVPTSSQGPVPRCCRCVCATLTRREQILGAEETGKSLDLGQLCSKPSIRLL